MYWVRFVVMAGTTMVAAVTLFAQDASPRPAIELQKEKLKAFAMMDGAWRGTAWTITSSGQRVEMTQTERVGPMLQGSVRLVEGRGFNEEGTIIFNALGVISFDAQAGKYNMRSYAQGRQGDFELVVNDTGFSWTIPAGPATIRYVATIKDGVWIETGERIVGDQPPVKFFEMNLKRIADSTWPAAGAVPRK